MTTDPKPSPSFSSRRRHLRLAGFLVLLVLVPVLFMPQVLQYGLPWYLERQGIQMQMSGADVDWLDRRIGLSDLRIGPRNGLALRFQQLDARLNPRALVAGEFPLEDLQLHGGELDFEALQRASLGGGGGAQGAQPIQIPEILIRDLRLKRIGKSIGREVVVKRLYLQGLEVPSPPQDSKSLTTHRLRSRIELQIQAGDASLGLAGTLELRGEILSADVHLRLHELKLAGLDKLSSAANRHRLGGYLSADTGLKIRYDPNEAVIRSSLSGSLDTRAFRYQDKDLGLALKASYQGQLGIDWPLSGDPAKFAAEGLLNLAALNLSLPGVLGRNGSLVAREVRYQGNVAVAQALAARGELRAGEMNLRLGSELRSLLAGSLEFAIDYHAGRPTGPLAVLTGLKAQSLRADFSDPTTARINAQGLRAATLRLANDYSLTLDSLAATGVESSGLAGPAAIRLEAANLKQLQVGSQRALTIATASAGLLEIPDKGQPLRLRSLELANLNRAKTGVVSLSRLAAGQFTMQRHGQSLQVDGLALTGLQQASDNGYSAASLTLQSLASYPALANRASGAKATDLNADAQAGIRSTALAVRQQNLNPGDAVWRLQEGRALDLRYSLKGDLKIRELQALQLQHQQRPGARVHLQQPVVEQLEVDVGNGTYQAARIRLAALSAQRSDPPARLTTGSLNLLSLGVDAQGNTDLDSAQASDLKLGAADPPQWSASTLTVGGLRYRDTDGLRLESLNLNDPIITLRQDATGHFNLPHLPFTGAGPDPEVPLPMVYISKLATQGKPVFDYIDQHVNPEYRLHIKPFSLQLDGFDTRPGAAAGQFKLSAQTGKFTNADISGKTRGSNSGVDVTLAGRLTGLDLKNLSPYTGTYEKFAIRKGSGDLTLSGTVHGGKLDLQTKLVVSKLELEPFYQGGSANPEGEDGSGSLATALMLLSDKNQTVKLKVPVTGTLDDPQFDFSDATGQAVAGVAKGAVMLAFKPLNILVAAAKFAGGISAMSVEPVEFAPGEAKLRAESITLLNSLAGKLKDLAKLKLQICGRVVKADREALLKKKLPAPDDARRDLAQSRTRVVRDYLEQKQLVAARQLETVCPDPGAGSEDAKPRADLSFDTRAISSKAKPEQATVPAN